jgi:thiol-disulfide isomerase/thioredoxin
MRKFTSRGSHAAGVLAFVVGVGLTATTCGRAAAGSAPAGAGANLARLSDPAPAAAAAGKGVRIRISDKPVAMPAFSATDLDGQPVTLADLKGKVVLVNFWATWCGPCREEIPALVALQNRYHDRLKVIGLSIDEGAPADVRLFAQQYRVNYTIAMVGPEVQQAFGGISAVPSTFVVNRDGQIVTRHVGMLDPGLTEQEVRVFAGLPSEATVETVEDTGQVLLANAAFATEIPGVDLSKLTAAQKEQVLKQLNTDHCTCGCGLTLAQCRINDPSCTVSLPLAQKIAAEAAGK